jgi:hypothetical protein
MKVCLIFKGLCKNQENILYHLENFKKNLKNYESIDIYFHTYNTVNLNKLQLINKINPKDFIFSDLRTDLEKYPNYSTKSLCNSLLQIINIIPNNYDCYIITRFDLNLKKEIDLFNLNKNKIYSSYKTNRKVQDDNLFIFF